MPRQGNSNKPESDQPPEADPTVSTRGYEQACANCAPEWFELVLYVAGAAPRSLRAITTIRRLCAEYLPGCHELQVVDIYQEPVKAELEGILAVPVLIKKSPLPRQTLVGDMSDSLRVLHGLGIQEHGRRLRAAPAEPAESEVRELSERYPLGQSGRASEEGR